MPPRGTKPRTAKTKGSNALEPVPELTEGQQRVMAARAAAGMRTARVNSGQHSSWNEDPTAQYASAFGSLYQQYASLAYWLPFEVLDYVEVLSTYNPDFSQAVDNIRTLANSGHQLLIDTDDQALGEEIKTRLEEKARTIQKSSGGVDGLIDKLLDQAAVYGAMCGEWVLSERMDDVVQFAEVNPKSIRFFFDEATQCWAPFQKVSLFQAQEAEKNGQTVKMSNFVMLNPVTFAYYDFDAGPSSPYGTPPFIGALANIAIQRDMITNMAQIVKKVGLLGIIDFTVAALQPDPGEDDASYTARANAYLDTYVTAIENMTRDGGIVHFDDSKASAYQITGNAAGATAIFKQNEELIFSGLKSMPSVQGRSYSTTETYAGVAYDIIIRNTQKYQRACKRMIEAGYWLMVMAWGYDMTKIRSIRLEFNSNKTLHRLQDAQAELMEIKNSLMLWAAGIINQIQMAQRHGVAVPATEYDDPPESQILGNGSPGGGDGATSISVGDSGGSAEGGQPGNEQTPGEEAGKLVTELLGLAPDDFRKHIIELGKKVKQSKRRSQAKRLSEETIAMQDEYAAAGNDHITNLIAEWSKVLGI